MNSRHYILDGHTPVPVDLMTWAAWLDEDRAKRRVAESHVGWFHISTVFIGLDHRFLGDGAPILFETMIFGDDEKYQTRCCTWDEAERMHAVAIAVAAQWIWKPSKIFRMIVERAVKRPYRSMRRWWRRR